MTWPFGALARGKYDVVVIDPAWLFRIWSTKGKKKSPQAHYRCQTIEEIKAWPVKDLLKPGGAAVIWSTWPMVALGAHTDVMQAWGLRPLTGGSWAKRTVNGKLRWGPGYVVRSVCEPYFFAALGNQEHHLRGRSVMNMIETLEAASVDAVARQHSRKPDEFYAMVRALTPGARRADVFSRGEHPGFEAFGDETDKFTGGLAAPRTVRHRTVNGRRRARP